MATKREAASNTLFYGDNLDILRRYVADESVDLVYLDPPFNSNANYNVLFAAKDGTQSPAQVHAFEDTWHWDEAAAESYHNLVERGGKVSEVLQAFRLFLGTNDMLAYLSMMAPRLVELHRVLKETGSLYLHCDPTASHYLKLLLDAVFGTNCFLSEIVWKRTGTHSSAKRWGPIHDTLLVYVRNEGAQKWNRLYVPLSEEHLKNHYRLVDAAGRRYERGELTAPGTRNGRSGLPWRGFDVAAIGRHWTTTIDKLEELYVQGRIYLPEDGGWPRLIRYKDESKGRAIGDVWEDIPPLNMKARERLGYPTQKPEALLERIIKASSSDGDVILDPFCGCGTAIAAAHRLNRRWIGIDVTHLAISLIKARLQDSYGATARYHVVGEPTTVDDAAELAKSDPWQFQYWALGLVGARPAEPKKGADKGIDGRLYFHNGIDTNRTQQVILSVKAGHLHAPHVRDLVGVVQREKAAIGVLLSFEKPTRAMRTEAASHGVIRTAWGNHQKIQLLTVGELLEGRRLDYPQTAGVNQTYKAAPKLKRVAEKSPSLFEQDAQ